MDSKDLEILKQASDIIDAVNKSTLPPLEEGVLCATAINLAMTIKLMGDKAEADKCKYHNAELEKSVDANFMLPFTVHIGVLLETLIGFCVVIIAEDASYTGVFKYENEAEAAADLKTLKDRNIIDRINTNSLPL